MRPHRVPRAADAVLRGESDNTFGARLPRVDKHRRVVRAREDGDRPAPAVLAYRLLADVRAPDVMPFLDELPEFFGRVHARPLQAGYVAGSPPRTGPESRGRRERCRGHGAPAVSMRDA